MSASYSIGYQNKFKQIELPAFDATAVYAKKSDSIWLMKELDFLVVNS